MYAAAMYAKAKKLFGLIVLPVGYLLWFRCWNTQKNLGADNSNILLFVYWTVEDGQRVLLSG